MADSIAHLHQHTEFSMLDGASRIGDVVAAAVRDGQPALGITDHGNMYGVLDFYAECNKHGIKPVIGIEAYQAHDSRFERPARRGRVDDSGGDVEGGAKLYYHLLLYAENNTGYRNLIQISSDAYLRGHHYKPRCLVGGQEIVTANGVKPIEAVEVGERVLTHKGRLRPVLQTMQREFKGTIYGIRLNNRYGRITWMTGEHPVLVRDQAGDVRWVEVQEIAAGRRSRTERLGAWRSFACLPKVRPDESVTRLDVEQLIGPEWTFNGSRFVKTSMGSKRGATRHFSDLEPQIVLDDDFGFFVGLYAAEGHTSRTEVCFTLHRDESYLIDAIRLTVKRLTGKEVSVRGRPDRPGYKGVQVSVSSPTLARLMERLCGRGANNKRLPDFTFDAPEEFRWGAYQGVVEGDGSDHIDHVILQQSSRDLAWQMRALAAGCTDSFASIRPYHDGDDNHAVQYRSNFAMVEHVGDRRTLSDDDYVYRPIAEILTKEYDGTVYNIEVADDHSYVSDFAIHNCDWESLEQYSEGVIATTGCLGGHVLQSLLRGDEQGALEKAARLQDIFGRDNLFVEVQDHGLPAQRQTNPKLLEIARKIKAPLLATNDSHYVNREDHLAHDALLCVQTGSTIDDPTRFKFEGDQHYLKSAYEMRSLFSEVPSACDNTLWIAERCNVEIEFGKPKLPAFPLPDGFGSDSEYLRHLTFEGARERWGEALRPDIAARLDFELNVIADMGFSSYFLIVWDLIAYARRSGIRVGPGRGSAAGSAVGYCLRITDIDPIKYDLLFERMLNPGRKQMPDIDMDFDDRYRDEMIRYAAEKYGRDHVAQIVTFSTIKARAAVRDAARVLGYPYALGDRIAKAMPPLVMGRDTPLYACFEEHERFKDGFVAARELREIYDTDPDAKKVIDVAKGLEGLRRQDGIHAAAVVITDKPLTEYLPIQRKPEPGKDIEDAPIVTQYEMHGVEELGLLKMDFLGLRNLSVIENALDLIERATGERPDIDNVDLTDEKALELLRRGESIGVFQLEGGPMRALMKSLAPTSFDDVAALVALYRPGPMAANMHNDYADRKNGRKPISYLHPDAEAILGPTYGLCLSGDTIVHEALTGRPVRLDEVDPTEPFFIQGADDDYAPVVRRVRRWMCNGTRETVRLRLSNGLSLTCTPDHEVLTDAGWRKVGELTTSDVVASPKKLLEPPLAVRADRDRLRVLSYLIADGSLTVTSAVSFVNSDDSVLGAFREAVTRAYPSVRLSERVGARDVTKITVGNGRGHGGGASPLLKWLRHLGLKHAIGEARGGCDSEEKFVPHFVFTLNDDDIAFFLAGLWDCDGHVNERFAHYRTVSARLAADVHALLLRLGIDARIYASSYIRPRDSKPMTAYQVTIFDGERFNEQLTPHLQAPQKRSVVMTSRTRGTTLGRAEVLAAAHAVWPGSYQSMGREFGISASMVQPNASRRFPRVHERTVATMLRSLECFDVLVKANVNWAKVEGVEPAGRQLVYDIQVDEVHNFVANGIVVHNCIYQEQMMRLAQKFAGYSLEAADNLRKAAGKKVRSIMAAEREKFVQGCVATGYGETIGNQWFDLIEPFADYAFNRSHSYGYGLVSFQTAWLKANHPVEYLSALLTSVKDNQDKSAVYLNECRTMGITVQVPDVNRSASDFAPATDSTRTILFGLSAVRNVGEGLVELIIREREANGPFQDFYDFCDRVDPTVLNKRAIESLVKAGAFDSLGHERKGLLKVHELIIDRTLARRRKEAEGQFELFASLDEPSATAEARVEIPAESFDKMERLTYEKEMLGLYVSDHPLIGVEGHLRRRCDVTIAELRDLGSGEMRVVGGVVTGLQRKYTKKGELMATFVLEDLAAACEVMVFPKTMTEHGYKLADDRVVCVKGRLDTRDDEPKIMAMEITVLEVTGDAGPPLKLQFPPHAVDETTVARLKKLLLAHPGPTPVLVAIGTQTIRLSPEFNVDETNGLRGELLAVFGPDVLKVS